MEGRLCCKMCRAKKRWRRWTRRWQRCDGTPSRRTTWPACRMIIEKQRSKDAVENVLNVESSPRRKTMSVTRRELFSMLPVALVPAILQSEESAGQENALPSAVYPFEKLPVRAPNGAQFRDVLKGKLATGESLEVHETTLPSGG